MMMMVMMMMVWPYVFTGTSFVWETPVTVNDVVDDDDNDDDDDDYEMVMVVRTITATFEL